jgi:hypothetical protein
MYFRVFAEDLRAEGPTGLVGRGGSSHSPQAGALIRPVDSLDLDLDKTPDVLDKLDTTDEVDSEESRLESGSVGCLGGRFGCGCVD